MSTTVNGDYGYASENTLRSRFRWPNIRRPPSHPLASFARWIPPALGIYAMSLTTLITVSQRSPVVHQILAAAMSDLSAHATTRKATGKSTDRDRFWSSFRNALATAAAKEIMRPVVVLAQILTAPPNSLKSHAPTDNEAMSTNVPLETASYSLSAPGLRQYLAAAWVSDKINVRLIDVVLEADLKSDDCTCEYAGTVEVLDNGQVMHGRLKGRKLGYPANFDLARGNGNRWSGTLDGQWGRPLTVDAKLGVKGATFLDAAFLNPPT